MNKYLVRVLFVNGNEVNNVIETSKEKLEEIQSEALYSIGRNEAFVVDNKIFNGTHVSMIEFEEVPNE